MQCTMVIGEIMAHSYCWYVVWAWNSPRVSSSQYMKFCAGRCREERLNSSQDSKSEWVTWGDSEGDSVGVILTIIKTTIYSSIFCALSLVLSHCETNPLWGLNIPTIFNSQRAPQLQKLAFPRQSNKTHGIMYSLRNVSQTADCSVLCSS